MWTEWADLSNYSDLKDLEKQKGKWSVVSLTLKNAHALNLAALIGKLSDVVKDAFKPHKKALVEKLKGTDKDVSN